MFTASFDGTDRIVIEQLLKKGPNAILAVVNRLNVLAGKLQDHIQRDKLEGQVLHRHTGKLIRSIHALPAQNNESSISADVIGAGGYAFYGRIHEYGGRPYTIVPTNKKALKFVVGNKTVFARRVNHPGLPERSFMRSSLDDMRELIETSITEAVQTAVEN